MSKAIESFSDTSPVRSKMISWFEFIDLTGSHPTRLGDLIEIGWLEPAKTRGDTYLFRIRDVYRVRKLERLCRDFELQSIGASIIVDLLARIEYLERKVRDLEQKPSG